MFVGKIDQKIIVRFFCLALIATLSKASGNIIEKRDADGDPNAFDMEIFRAASEDFDDEDVLISPISLRIALGMLLEGARHETAMEIRRALRLPDDLTLLRQETKKWVNILTENDGTNTTLKTANRIFVDRLIKIKDEYRRNIKEIYDADLADVDKSQPKATVQEINDWIKRNTNGMIQEVMKEENINKNFALAEVNTIYFKGNWQYQFPKKETQLDCFYIKNNECVQIEMMNTTIESLPYAYIKELNAKAIDLPYDDKKHSMLILLPEYRFGIHELLQKTVTYSIDKISSKLAEKTVYVRIPKFKAQYQSEMKKSLTSLKINRIFGLAQFSGMIERSDKPLMVSEVFHTAKIEVNEDGSEAAAVTVIQVELVGPFRNDTRIFFTADHPFLFFLRDISTNAVLFAGKYTGPKKN